MTLTYTTMQLMAWTIVMTTTTIVVAGITYDFARSYLMERHERTVIGMRTVRPDRPTIKILNKPPYDWAEEEETNELHK